MNTMEITKIESNRDLWQFIRKSCRNSNPNQHCSQEEIDEFLRHCVSVLKLKEVKYEEVLHST